MGLKKLLPEHIEEMRQSGGCNIYFVGFSESYAEELLKKYDIVSQLAGILLDTDTRAAGNMKKGSQKISCHGIDLPVFSYKRFERLEDKTWFIILDDYYKETYERLIRRNGRNDESNSDIYYFVNHETEIALYYQEKYKGSRLEDIIVYRSGPHVSSYVRGMDYADNARALFEYMLREDYNQTYELVWLVKNPLEFLHIEQQYTNVHFISFDWAVSSVKEEQEIYYRALYLAKYIFMTDAYGFCRNARKDQIRVQLWHGCGLKTRINFNRCESRYEYNIVISQIYKKIHQEIYGLREDQVLVTGYPKNDWLFHPITDWREKLHLPEAKFYIFWLPTFRTPVEQLAELKEKAPDGPTGLPIVQSKEKLQELNTFLRKKEVCLLVKLHPFQDVDRVSVGNLTNFVLLTNERLVEEGIQVNQILGNADGLISDYSSAAIDFLLLNKPLAFTVDDIEEYEKNRGFVFTPIREWLPGNIIGSYSDFIRFIEGVIAGEDMAKEKRIELTEKFHEFHDDQSSRRVLEALGIRKF